MIVEVFKTNVQKISQAKKLIALLLHHFPESKVNFDLKDCDKVLRVAAVNCMAEQIVFIIKEHGYSCTILN